MKARTDEEIKDFIQKLYPAAYSSRDLEVDVIRSEHSVTVNVKQMYEYVSVGFKELQAIGSFFETDKVNGSEGDYHSGCETCDYGSSYEVNFVIEA